MDCQDIADIRRSIESNLGGWGQKRKVKKCVQNKTNNNNNILTFILATVVTVLLRN